jgi:predicted dehydrogenase
MKLESTHSSRAGNLPRRDFLKNILAAGAITAIAPGIILAQSSGKKKPDLPKKYPGSHKIKLACVGIGNRGNQVFKEFEKTGLAEFVALCDTDIGAPHTQRVLKAHPDLPRFQDFRKMFDKMAGQIDAVAICTPDFSHFPIAMLAMSLGKHVFVEKPMAHTFRQIELMMAAEKKYNIATQMGNQGHSMANYFQFQAWVDAGIIKNVTKITAYMNNWRRWHGKTFADYLPAEPIPATLDWDTWLATAEYHKYNIGYTQGDWRSWFDFGNGALGDWGAHIIDTAHRFLDLGLPAQVESLRLDGPSRCVFPQESTLAFRFPARDSRPPLEVTWYDGQNNLPPLPDNMGDPVSESDIPPPSAGSNESKKLPPGKIIYGQDLTFKGGSHGSTLQIIPEGKAKDMASKLPPVPQSTSTHYANFLLACQGMEKTRSPFSISGPLCQTMAIGVIAQRTGGRLDFDRKTKRITNNKLADAMLDGVPPRKEWEQYYKL